MSAVINAKNLNKSYGQYKALDNISFSIEPGRIVGLIGPNGAGKTTLLKSILGLASVDGDLDVMGIDPRRSRTTLLNDVSFIADTAILPKWLKVNQAVDYMAAMHPNFQREKVMAVLERTSIKASSKVSELSKGMVTQLHLALIMAIDSQLLVLDEPTLGLDIVYRKQFYTTLLNEYFDEQKTILITTHQVEEIENILTDLIFIQQGKVVLDSPMEAIGDQFLELQVSSKERSRVVDAGLVPIYEAPVLGGTALIFEGVDRKQLQNLGDVKIPTIADLFVAKMHAVGEYASVGGL